jgi:hypothetical protein
MSRNLRARGPAAEVLAGGYAQGAQLARAAA